MARTVGQVGRGDSEEEAAGLRPLGLPRPVGVATDEFGLPAVVTLAGRRRALPVEQVEEVWRIAEEWWREVPLGRTYYRVIVGGGRPLTLFHNDLVGDWYEQRY